MTEKQPLSDDLFIKNSAEQNLPSGQVRERRLKIIDAQVAVWQQELEQKLNERKSKQTEEENLANTDLLQRHIDDRFSPPSFENGPYANKRHLNFYELFEDIIDLDLDSELLSDKDQRITFPSFSFGKKGIILVWLRDQIQNNLEDDDKLRKKQLSDMFDNISQIQMNAITEQILQSGLTILSETFGEKWGRMVKESRDKQSD